MTIQNFIKQRPYLIWHTKNWSGLSEAAIVEAVLNYGDWADVKKLIAILGRKKTARIFRERSRGKRSNYSPKVANYFRLYFKNHA